MWSRTCQRWSSEESAGDITGAQRNLAFPPDPEIVEVKSLKALEGCSLTKACARFPTMYGVRQARTNERSVKQAHQQSFGFPQSRGSRIVVVTYSACEAFPCSGFFSSQLLFRVREAEVRPCLASKKTGTSTLHTQDAIRVKTIARQSNPTQHHSEECTKVA